jgi:hypothetical protein
MSGQFVVGRAASKSAIVERSRLLTNPSDVGSLDHRVRMQEKGRQWRPLSDNGTQKLYFAATVKNRPTAPA